MSNPYLSENLIAAVRESGMLPPADEGAQTSRLFGFVNREQRLYLMRLMLSVRESYRVAIVDVPLQAGRLEYPIPTRAVGAKLKLVEILGTDGAPGRALNCVGAARVYETTGSGGAADFTIRNNGIVFLAQPAAGTMRLHYFRRFNRLVPAAEASGSVAGFDTATGVLTVSLAEHAMPATFSTSARYDIVQGAPHFDLLAADLTASAVTASTVTFAPADLPTDLAVGDFIALAGETPICQAPLELHDVLVQRGLVAYLESQGDARAAVAAKTLERMRDDALALLSPRLEDQPETLINYDAPGWQRSGYRRGGWP